MYRNLLAQAAILAMLAAAFDAGATGCTAAHPNANLAESTPTSAFTVDNVNGTVTHSLTGLMWKQCAEGLSGSGCATGTATTKGWQAALKLAVTDRTAGYSDWRLPNVKELESLVENCGYGPAINRDLFPATPISTAFWSGSPDNSTGAWFVNFNFGDANADYKTTYYFVRLVRGGQSFDSFDAVLTTVSSSLNPSTAGASVTLTATVDNASATGTVAFKDGGANITGCAAQPVTVTAGVATATCATSALTPGSHTLTAVYSGDGSYSTSTGANFTQTVNAAAPAAPSVTVAPGNAQATLTFATPADNGAALSGYTVTLGGGATQTLTLADVTQGATVTAAGYTATITSAAPGNTVITVTGLTNGTGYTFAVGASNSAGAGTASTASAVTPTAPSAPSAPSGGGDYTPPSDSTPPSNPILPSGGGTATLTGGQSVTVTKTARTAPPSACRRRPRPPRPALPARATTSPCPAPVKSA